MLWNMRCFVLPYILKVCAVFLLGLGAVIVWCECTMGYSTDLSPLSHLIRHVEGEVLVQVRRLCCAPADAVRLGHACLEACRGASMCTCPVSGSTGLRKCIQL